MTLKAVAVDGASFNGTVYEWMTLGTLKMEVGFLVDGLTAMMMCVVTFVSLMVHIYTIGYMEEDDGYQRFFSYISLFTFSMLMLVMSNNLLQLFFGWEAVGLVSYLLIGFWYKKPTAIFANMKAFLVNRVGDFGFILGIGLLLAYTGTLNYTELFAKGSELSCLTLPKTDWALITVICVCLFIGAMGKSAQFPLHVWLPDSMEGPTPISALIHAATMVTAGIFMVSRMSPLFELSDAALNFIVIIGSITALFMGFPGHHPERHQACGGLLHAVAAGLHDRGPGRVGLQRGHVPRDDARLLQGPAVPRRGLGDHRHAPRSGHPQHGWPVEAHAHHLDHLPAGQPGPDRHTVLLGLLLEGLDHHGGSRQHLPAAGFAEFAVLAGVFVTAFLQLPCVLPGLPRQGALPSQALPG
jgi:NADH-quinone oxidoreductase subunit L